VSFIALVISSSGNKRLCQEAIAFLTFDSNLDLQNCNCNRIDEIKSIIQFLISCYTLNKQSYLREWRVKYEEQLQRISEF